MAKLSKKDKIEIYNRRQQGESILDLAIKFNICESGVEYLVNLIDHHGLQILEKTKNNYYPKEMKERIINEVLIKHNSIQSVSLRYGLPSKSILSNWIKQYKANGGIIVEKRRGRLKSMKKPTKPYDQMTLEEKVQFLEKKAYYLEAENAYLKKLDALIQQRNKKSAQKKK